MNDFHCEFHINAAPQKVYEALAYEQGPQHWWTQECTMDSQEGGKATFRFGETYTVMQIEKLIPNTSVIWRCIDHHHVEEPPLARTDEWVGTRLVFDIKENPQGGTTLTFTHQGLNQALSCYDICEERWGHFLQKSLKSYLETGQGQPS